MTFSISRDSSSMESPGGNSENSTNIDFLVIMVFKGWFGWIKPFYIEF